MRHFIASVSITLLTRSVLYTPTMGLLIAFSSCFYRGFSSNNRTGTEAIEIAMIAMAADHHLAVTTDAEIEAGSVHHRGFLPMRTGLFLKMDTYYPCRAKARFWGAVSETVEVVTRCRTCLNSARYCPDFSPDVTRLSRSLCSHPQGFLSIKMQSSRGRTPCGQPVDFATRSWA